MKTGEKHIVWLTLGFAVFAVNDVRAMSHSSQAEPAPVAQTIPSDLIQTPKADNLCAEGSLQSSSIFDDLDKTLSGNDIFENFLSIEKMCREMNNPSDVILPPAEVEYLGTTEPMLPDDSSLMLKERTDQDCEAEEVETAQQGIPDAPYNLSTASNDGETLAIPSTSGSTHTNLFSLKNRLIRRKKNASSHKKKTSDLSLELLKGEMEKLKKEVELLKAGGTNNLEKLITEITPVKPAVNRPVAVITKYVEDVRPDQDSEEMSSRTQVERQEISTVAEKDTALDELSMPTLSPQQRYSASQNIKSAEMTEKEIRDLLYPNREKLLREWNKLLAEKNNDYDNALSEWKKLAYTAANKARDCIKEDAGTSEEVKKQKESAFRRVRIFSMNIVKNDSKRKKNDQKEETSLQPQKKKINLEKEVVTRNSIPLIQQSLPTKRSQIKASAEEVPSFLALVKETKKRSSAISSWLENKKQSKDPCVSSSSCTTPQDKPEDFISNPRVRSSHSKKSASFEEIL